MYTVVKNLTLPSVGLLLNLWHWLKQIGLRKNKSKRKSSLYGRSRREKLWCPVKRRKTSHFPRKRGTRSRPPSLYTLFLFWNALDLHEIKLQSSCEQTFGVEMILVILSSVGFTSVKEADLKCYDGGDCFRVIPVRCRYLCR